MKLIIYGQPIGKPRMVRSDKWQRRPAVLRYWAWCDVVRGLLKRTTKITLQKPTVLTVRAFFADGTKKHRVGPHTQKPDGDNILKSVCDALFQNDEMIYRKEMTKLWADGGPERVEVEWE